jgi:protoheme IX farnesyltransferase
MAGVVLALAMDRLYGAIVLAGLFFDVVVYTLWLKRRTHWSIVWGGIAGGMPVLAGRTLGLGQLDWTGVLLALAVLLWIPSHILTFNMRHFEDYQRAGIPTFPAAYGLSATRAVIAVTSVAAALAVAVAGIGIGMAWGFLRLLGVMGGGLLLLAFSSLWRPSERNSFGLFKYASLYMMGSMLLVVLETV